MVSAEQALRSQNGAFLTIQCDPKQMTSYRFLNGGTGWPPCPVCKLSNEAKFPLPLKNPYVSRRAVPCTQSS